MPTTSTPLSSGELQSCSLHPQEQVKLYCRTHGNLGCIICMTVSHKQCDIDYIPDVSETFLTNGNDYIGFKSNLDTLKVRCDVGLREIGLNTATVTTTYDDVIRSIENKRIEILAKLDEIVNKSKEQASEFRKTNLNKMQELKESFQSILHNINEMETKTEQLKTERKFNLLYCHVKNAQSTITEFQSQVYGSLSKLNREECELQSNSDITELESIFGTINIEQKAIQSHCNASEVVHDERKCLISIKGNSDRKTCFVSGIAFLSPGQLAVADKANKNVKIVDADAGKMISEITLSSSPRDITVVPPDKLAVTLRDEKLIQFLSTSSGLAKDRQIKTGGKCRNIQFDRGNLIVVFNDIGNAKVVIMSLEGKELQVISTCVMGPRGVGLTPDHNYIYVTSSTDGKLKRFSRHGTGLQTSEGKYFEGLAVSGYGSVFVTTNTGSEGHVYQLDDDLSNMRPILMVGLELDGIRNPIALAICRETNLLVISCGRGGADICNNLHVYQILPTNI
ncbi:uncharacterized protein LOC132735250 [Ruditapes philippinarum]|uniref:uncharacterized protein LOC132735250 n=1 Tax=Ruditapes philippinarum TaxID=129788 RepID=UPI00295A9A04|nr:uncharacterized protein LOC132735250 [Ruditapes philippinarum]